MRHAVRGRKLGRTSAHREALFRNQLQSLVDKERIITTLPKAKELRPIAERVITRGKRDSIPARRWALRWLIRRELVKKLFDEIAPRFEGRPGGYLRIVKLGPRQGDGAEMALIEMVELGEDVPKPGESKKTDGGPAKTRRGAKKQGGKAAAPAAGAAAKDTSEGGEEEAQPRKAAKGADAKKESRKEPAPKSSTRKAGKAKPTRQKTG
jgi:large subunit ribosomal protein L17